MKRLHYEIRGMSCAACVAHVEKAIRSSLSPADTVSVSLLTNSVSILLSEDPPSLPALEERLAAAVRAGGYTLLLGDAPPTNEGKERKQALLSLLLSAALTLLVMYLSMGPMLGIPLPPFLAGEEHALLLALSQLIITLPVLFLNRRFFLRGLRALLSLSPNMDSLIAVGSGASVIYGIVSMILLLIDPSPEHQHALLHDLYFESAAMILTLVSLGKLLESGAKDKAAGAIRSLATLSPKFAAVLRDGKEISLPVDDLEVGDLLLLRPGDLVPVDGTVVEGMGALDESAITGESLPVEASVGKEIRAASVVTAGFLTVKATHVGKDTSLSRIVRLLEDAAAGKPPIARIADRVSGVFVPVVMLISLVTFLVWILSTKDLSQSLRSAISVLVISCPCALGLATPTAITVGLGRSAGLGILFCNATALETLSSVKTVVFDKTGTITEGNPSLTDAVSLSISPLSLLSLAAAVEEGSSHPLALAVRKAALAENLTPPVASDFETVVGHGVFASLGGSRCAVLKPVFPDGEISLPPPSPTLLSLLASADAESCGEATLTTCDSLPSLTSAAARLEREGKTVVLVQVDGTPVGILAIADRVRPEAKEAVEILTRAGVECRMLTGDRESTALAVASAVGIRQVSASLLPEDKERIVRSLSEDGAVAMVGDGINDAPSLVSATVGIAIGAGSETAIESADVVLSSSSPRAVADAYLLSRATLRIIRQNLFWALFYNAICIPVAAGVLYPFLGWQLSPMLASAAMSLSSVTVVTNALRLKRISINKGDKTMLNLFKKKTAANAETVILNVEGMMCPRCVAHVKEALEKVSGVTSVEVSLEQKTATVVGTATREALAAAVVAAGYEVK